MTESLCTPRLWAQPLTRIQLAPARLQNLESPPGEEQITSLSQVRAWPWRKTIPSALRNLNLLIVSTPGDCPYKQYFQPLGKLPIFFNYVVCFQENPGSAVMSYCEKPSLILCKSSFVEEFLIAEPSTMTLLSYAWKCSHTARASLNPAYTVYWSLP